MALGLILGLAVIPLWASETHDAERKDTAHDYAEAISGVPFDDVEPDRTIPIAVGVVGALLFLAGVVVTVSPGASPSPGSPSDT